MTISKEAIEVAAVKAANAVGVTPYSDMRPFVEQAVKWALSTLPIAGEDIETATLKERLRAATVARKAAREALEKGFLNRIPDRVFDAVHEASSFPPNLDAADARSSTLEQKLKVATEALENIQQTRCDHDMGFDREIGPLGCSLGDKCVCVGLCTIASQALLETSALSAPSSPGKDGGQEVEAVAWISEHKFEKGRYWLSEPNGKGDAYWSDAFQVYRRTQPVSTAQEIEAEDRFGMKFVVNEQVPSGEAHIRDANGNLLGKIVNTAADEWTCAARKQSLPEPADCDWPFCGCDPHADKVIAAIEESGRLDAQPATTALVERLEGELSSAASLLETLAEDLPEDDVSGVMMRVMAERNRSALSASTSREGER